MAFDFHHRDRIKNLIEELEDIRYRETRELGDMMFLEDGGGAPTGEGQSVNTGFSWIGWDRYNWLTAFAEIPKEWEKKEVLGLFDFGARVGTGNGAGFESLLYLNGEAYQAVDGNHHEVFLKPEINGLAQELKFRLWAGLSGGGVPVDNKMEIVQAQIAVLDHPTDDFYYLAKAALEAYDLLPDEHEYRQWILNTLVRAFTKIDYTEPKSDGFYDSVKEAWEFLDKQFDGRGKPDVSVSLIGHTHIDVAWLWRLRHTREKAIRSFTTVNRLMEEYPEYLFLQTQAQLYEYIKEDAPLLYEQIKSRIRESRWEPSGAMWVECDCNLTSGESIIRQILIGKNFFKQEFGYENDYLWLPDVFGYAWALPQILKKSGINTFMTTKISWNDTNRLPYDTFFWRGIDGTEVTAHFITTTDPDEDFYTYNGNTTPYAIKGVWDTYKNKDTNKDLLISFGYGDGGGGPTRGQIKQAQAADKIPGLPHVKQELPSAYFRRLNQTIKENPMDGYIPVWDGELYLEFHRGTYTSQGYNKKMNRRMEYTLREAEMLSVWANAVAGVPYAYDLLLKAWKIVLCHQFHDILPGSSIKEVYEDSRIEYDKALEYITGVMKCVDRGLYTPKEGYFSVYNLSNWRRSGVAAIKLTKAELTRYAGCEITGDDGRKVKADWHDAGVDIWASNIEPFASRAYTFTKEQSNAETAAVEKNAAKSALSGGSLDTPFYKISWNEFGQLSCIYDKAAGREVLPKGKCANVFSVFEDKPRCFDAWELEPTIDLKKEVIKNCTKISEAESNLGHTVTFEWQYHHSVIYQKMCLYHESPRIDFITTVDWQERQKLLKVSFPVDVRATDARFDIQNGNIRRPITRNTTWEAAKFEIAAHKWVDIWETGYGMALLNDCKYGHDVLEDTIRLTLLKSAVEPDYTADIGTHEFTYAILPHHTEWYAANIEQQAFDLNCPLTGKAGVSRLGKESWIHFDKDNLVVDAIKREENGERIILRFHEFEGRRGMVKISCRLPVKQWCECNLMEEPGEFTTGEIEAMLKPYEIKTLMLEV